MTQKSNPETLGLSTRDVLVWEGTPLSRVKVTCATTVKVGDFVEHPKRDGKKYIALIDGTDGYTLIQPFNCVMDLQHIDNSKITTASTDVDTLKKDGDAYGIVYQNTPKGV